MDKEGLAMLCILVFVLGAYTLALSAHVPTKSKEVEIPITEEIDKIRVVVDCEEACTCLVRYHLNELSYVIKEQRGES